MGRELVRLLVAEGCAVAMCDVSPRGMAETRRSCEASGLPQGLRLTSHVADVSNEADVLRFRDEVAAQHASDRIHLLFNNAGISGGGSMIVNERAEWERTFNICWGGVYLNTRAFLPMLRAADEAHIVNTSSMNGFWASVGPDTPHTAYSAAKGSSEALVADFRRGWAERRADRADPRPARLDGSGRGEIFRRRHRTHARRACPTCPLGCCRWFSCNSSSRSRRR
jgi:NAD(P)-dependent dehydrogenase (short-subunit alcohol dehydrogenase family)